MTDVVGLVQTSPQLKSDLLAAIPKLRAFAVSLCGNPDRADDLVQETLVKAWSHRKRRREVADSEGLIAARLASAPTQNGHMDFLDFRAALQKLPADQREALVLIGASGLSYEEAAGICHCAVGTMKSRVNRARHRLIELLSIGSSSDFVSDPNWQTGLDTLLTGHHHSGTGGD